MYGTCLKTTIDQSVQTMQGLRTTTLTFTGNVSMLTSPSGTWRCATKGHRRPVLPTLAYRRQLNFTDTISAGHLVAATEDGQQGLQPVGGLHAQDDRGLLRTSTAEFRAASTGQRVHCHSVHAATVNSSQMGRLSVTSTPATPCSTATISYSHSTTKYRGSLRASLCQPRLAHRRASGPASSDARRDERLHRDHA